MTELILFCSKCNKIRLFKNKVQYNKAIKLNRILCKKCANKSKIITPVCNICGVILIEYTRLEKLIKNRLYYKFLKEETRQKFKEKYETDIIFRKKCLDRGKKYYQNKREEQLEKEHNKALLLKKEVLTHYNNGNCSCVVCNFDKLDALTIDHIEGNGNKHRKKIGGSGRSIYRWLKTNNYPDGYRVLCMNCQIIERNKKLQWGTLVDIINENINLKGIQF